MTDTTPAVDLNNGRRFLVFLRNAIVHKRRFVAGQAPFQYFEPTDVQRLGKLKTTRLATEDEIRAAYLADARGETHVVKAEQLAQPAERCTGIAPKDLEESGEPSFDDPPSLAPTTSQNSTSGTELD